MNNRRIGTLDSLAGRPGRAAGAAGETAAPGNPEAWAATLKHLANLIGQTGGSNTPLPAGTRVDWPLPQALSAAARLMPEGRRGGSAFQGYGRVLGPMAAAAAAAVPRLGAAAPAPAPAASARSARYNLRPRFSIASTVAHPGTPRHGGSMDLDADEDAEDGAAVVVRDALDPDGTRKIEVQMPQSPGSVTLVIPQRAPSPSVAAVPPISFQLSPEFHLPRELWQGGADAHNAHGAHGVARAARQAAPSAGTDTDETSSSDVASGIDDSDDADYDDSDGGDDAIDAYDAYGGVDSDADVQALRFLSNEQLFVDDVLDSNYGSDGDGMDDLVFAVDNAAAGEQPLGAPAALAAADRVRPADPIDCTGGGHIFHGHRQPPVGTRLEQALAYLARQNPTTDRQWHARIAAIEAYLDFLQGEPAVAEGSGGNGGGGSGDAANQILTRLEANEAAAAARAEGRATAAHGASAAAPDENPPPLHGANTRALLHEARLRLRAHRIFYGYHQQLGQDPLAAAPRARIVTSASAVAGLFRAGGSGGASPEPPLQTLLTTSGRSFAGRLIVGAEADQRARAEEQEQQQGQQAGESEDAAAGAGLLDDLLPDPGAVPPGSLLGLLETHPYTIQMARYRRLRQHWMAEARAVAERENADNPQWAALPPCDGAYGLGYAIHVPPGAGDGGPGHGPGAVFVRRRPLPPAMKHDRRLLGLLHGLGLLLLRRLNVAPRPLLADVLRYVEQGLRGQPLPDGALQLREAFDFYEPAPDPQAPGRSARARPPPRPPRPGPRAVRRLSEAEARWLQFLLSDSTNEALAGPLPAGPHLEEDRTIDARDAQLVAIKRDEEGSRALYHAFAQRLQSLLDEGARSAGGGLFPAADTRVSVTRLLAALNRRAAGQGHTQFCVYDALQFLTRLQRAGRCRFHYAPFDATHGFVQRPRLTIHPEHRIHQSGLTQGLSGARFDDDDALGAPRQALEVDAGWSATVASGRAQAPLAPAIRTFFCALAFRLGRTLRALETDERPRWQAHWRDGGGAAADADADADADNAGDDSDNSAMRAALRTWHRTYRRLLAHNGVLAEAAEAGVPTSLADVVRLADPDTFGEGGLSEAEARGLVRRYLLAEAASGQTAPLALTAAATAAHGGRHGTALWDWAQPAVAGAAPRHFFHMDRWPLHLQTRATAAAVRDAARVAFDPEVLWDPASEDPAAPGFLWLRGKHSSYAFCRVEPAKPTYELGDTALQRQAVIGGLTRRVAAALGMDPAEGDDGGDGTHGRKGRGLLAWLGKQLPLGGGRVDDDDDDDDAVEVINFETTQLPDVTDAPASIDWMAIVDEALGGGERVDGVDGMDGNGERRSAGAHGVVDDVDSWSDADDDALMADLAAGGGSDGTGLGV